MEPAIALVTMLVLAGIAVAIYILPMVIAVLARRRQALAISVLNLLLGWSLIGWVVALVWACIEDK